MKKVFSEEYGFHYCPLKFVRNEYLPHIYDAHITGLQNPSFHYGLTIEKLANGKWLIYAEDNEPEDFDQSVFKSLKDAKAAFQEWAMEWLWCEWMGKDDPDFTPFEMPIWE